MNVDKPSNPAPWNKGRRLPPEPLTGDACRALIKACSNRAPTGIRNRALLVLLYRGGLRLDEALQLKPKDLDRQQGAIRVLHGKGDKSRVVGLDEGGWAILQRWLDKRAELGISGRQHVICTLQGESLAASYVRGFSRCLDNSFINKTLCDHQENRNRKRNRTPWEAYHHTPQWDEIIQRVKRFQGDARAKKLALFQAETLPNQDEFTQKQLSDTRYISRIASQYLGLLYGGKLKIDKKGTLRVRVMPGRATAYLRQRWHLNDIIGHDDEKNRDDHRRHAIDALVVALTNPRAIQLLAHAAEEAEERADPKLFADVDPPWKDFHKEADAAIKRINVSSRVSRKLNGPLHKDTNLSNPRVETDKKGRQVEVHYVRKRLDSMSIQEVDAIVDDAVRKLVKQRLEKIGGTPQQAFKDENNHPHFVAGDGRIIPIHKARIKKSDRPMPVGQGSRRRYVNPGSNHHIEIVAVLDKNGREKRWEGVLVSRFEAAQRRRRGEPVIQREHGPGKEFRF